MVVQGVGGEHFFRKCRGVLWWVCQNFRWPQAANDFLHLGFTALSLGFRSHVKKQFDPRGGTQNPKPLAGLGTQPARNPS